MGFLDKLNDFFGNRPRKYSEDGYYKYALKQEELGNIDEAIECYEIILSHDKQHYDSYARLFELYPKRQKWAQMKKMGQQFNENLWHLKSSLGHHAIQDAQSALIKEVAKAAAMKPQSNATKVSENSHPTPKATAKVDVPPTQKQVANNKSKISLPKKEDYLPDERNYSSFGVRYAAFSDDLPKFDFYKSDNFEIPESATERIHSFLLTAAKFKADTLEFAEKGDHQTAARWCAELIKQNYWEPWPYELLIDIYQKHDHTTEATEQIKYSIKFFENLRANMEWRLLYLAEQQNETEFAKSLIKKGKKVSYPEGLYVLYDPYPCIDKFKAML